MKKLLCFFGWHQWICSVQDYIDEFGFIPLDNRISSKSKCGVCGKKYSLKKD
jgi:hypothetical protein